MLSITLIDDVQGWQIELGQGRGDAGGVGIQLRWSFPMDRGLRREGMFFSLLSWLGNGLSLKLSVRERKDDGEAGWDTLRGTSLLEHLNCPTRFYLMGFAIW